VVSDASGVARRRSVGRRTALPANCLQELPLHPWTLTHLGILSVVWMISSTAESRIVALRDQSGH